MGKNKIIFTILFSFLISIYGGFFLGDILRDENIVLDDSVINLNLDDINGETQYVYKKNFEKPISSIALTAILNNDNDISNNVKYDYRYFYENKWTTWNEFDLEEDDGEETENNKIDSELTFLGSASAIEIKMDSGTPMSYDELKLLTFEVDSNKPNPKILSANASEGVKIITRDQWGANESWRLYDPENPPPTPKKVADVDSEWIKKYADDIKIVKVENTDKATGKKLIWPFEYTENIEKIAIHHSAGRTPKCEEEIDFLRSIYKFHTLTRGWGDIGYNYIVGPCSGNIYQGRAGSWGVKGAHAGKFNAKNIGVMVMGNYQNEDPSDKSIDTLVNLSRFLGEKYGIRPNGTSKTRGLILYNIFGHRDVSNTTCPGDRLYARLPEIRQRAMEGFVFPENPYRVDLFEATKKYQGRSSYAAQPVVSNTNQMFLRPGESQNVKIMFKNTGQVSWNNKTYIKTKGTTLGLKFNGKQGSKNIATQVERSVSPNDIATFEVEIKASDKIFKRHFVFDFVVEGNGSHAIDNNKMEYDVMVFKNRDEEITNHKLQITNDEGEVIHDDGIEKQSEIIKGDNNVDMQNSAHMQESNTQELFLDVKPDNVFYSYIQDLKEHEIISGNGGYFYPEDYITRGEFSKVIVKAAKLDLMQTNRSFVDISGNVFEEFIRILQGHKIVKGNNGKFYPNLFVSRAEAVTMVVKAFNLTGETEHRFRDMIDSVFEPFVLKAVANGVIGAGQIFDPNALISRDQVAKIVSKAIKSVETSVSAKNLPKQAGKKGHNVRVDLNFSDEEFVIKNSKKYNVYDNESLLKENLDASTLTTVRKENHQYKVIINGEDFIKDGPIRFTSYGNGIMEIVGQNRLGGNIPYNHYQGDLEIRIDPEIEDKLYIINELPLEDYLSGLGEEPQGQPIEKVKAVVVMARSYIEYYRNLGGKFKERHADLKSDGVTSQVYLGVDFANDNPIILEAVKATTGEFLTYDGAVIRSPYFSKSGGHTITPGTEGNTWTASSFPFAISVEDPWSCDKDLAYIEENGTVTCPDNQRGHGVGVSAFGAKAMALEGKTYKEIIQYYLTDVEFEKLY